MPAGRPTTYKPEYCDAVIEHMAEGASLTSFAASVGAARSTINEWMGIYEENRFALERGIAGKEYHYEDSGWVKFGEIGSITVRYLGETNEPRGVILASFNAG
jgi:hypothetical protein